MTTIPKPEQPDPVEVVPVATSVARHLLAKKLCPAPPQPASEPTAGGGFGGKLVAMRW